MVYQELQPHQSADVHHQYHPIECSKPQMLRLVYTYIDWVTVFLTVTGLSWWTWSSKTAFCTTDCHICHQQLSKQLQLHYYRQSLCYDSHLFITRDFCYATMFTWLSLQTIALLQWSLVHCYRPSSCYNVHLDSTLITSIQRSVTKAVVTIDFLSTNKGIYPPMDELRCLKNDILLSKRTIGHREQSDTCTSSTTAASFTR